MPPSYGVSAAPSYGSFSYAPMAAPTYATPLCSPLAIPTPFAPHFSKASSLLPSDVTYTTYSLNPKATTSADGPYGQSAYAAPWASQNLTFTDHPPFTTTVSPTPIPSAELVKPPSLPLLPADTDSAAGLKFPSDFVWGVASSAFQIEGGLQLAGRGPSALDGAGTIGGDDNNVDAMFYYLYKQDLERLAAIGIPNLCFSIPWTRVVPFGVSGSPVNTEALDHYDDLINTAIAHGITPIVTILHFDTPANVPYTDSDFAKHYLYYAKQIVTRYADRVPYWVSVNEPNLQPVNNGLTNILTAHANLYHWYKNELKGTGKITMKFANDLAIPRNTSSTADIAAAQRYQEYILGIMSNPLFLGKQIPSSVLSTKGINITALTPAQISLFHGTMDFFSFDPYSAQYVAAPEGGIEACAADPKNPLYPTCVNTTNVDINNWLIGQASSVGYSFIAPQYVREQMSYVWDTYKPKGVMITEYGFPSYGDNLQPLDVQRYDLLRTSYYQAFLTEVLKSIHLDGVNMIGALAWSFVETNEFVTFDSHYGLQTLNHTTFARTYKRSAFDYVDFFHNHGAK